LGEDLSWRWAYAAIAVLQAALVVGFWVTIRSWPGPTGRAEGHEAVAVDGSSGEVAPAAVAPHGARAAAVLGPAVFLAYGALEVSVGAWAYVLLTGRGVAPAAAAASVTAYWGALALGRLLLGGPGHRLAPGAIVSASIALSTVAAVALWLVPGAWSVVPLVLVGLGLAGIFPALTTLTPARVGQHRAPGVIGAQLAAAVVGGAAGSALVGVVAQHAGSSAIGPCLVVASALLLVTDVVLTLACTQRGELL
jgi:fucose permease